jgi:hypothetical protein
LIALASPSFLFGTDSLELEGYPIFLGSSAFLMQLPLDALALLLSVLLLLWFLPEMWQFLGKGIVIEFLL